ncbi:MAG: methionyl-tRNA formyltransferase [Opitutaceae bacterium]|nr:methionyl-tRNA formyltransferase [Cytophagales bacterium]
MGTPEFAVPSLQILVENGYNVVGVITAPDKPSGRGLQLNPSPVKVYAESVGLNILQPDKLKNPEFLAELQKLNANVQVVVAFRMLPEAVWNMPPKGTFNLHASLLPQYRGAAPINWAIINGEKETGATTFFLQHEIDTGDIILQEKEEIHEEDNIGSLYERLMVKGASLVLKTIVQIDSGNIKTKPQILSNEIKLAPKIFKETCKIDWTKSAIEIHNLVRGLSPYPAAFFTLNGKNCKVFLSQPDVQENDKGSFISDNKTFLKIKCELGHLSIKELQLEGKKKMTIEEFLRGTKIESVA